MESGALFLLDFDLYLLVGIGAILMFLGLAIVELGVQLRRLFGSLLTEMSRHDPALLKDWDWPMEDSARGWGNLRQTMRRELIEARIFMYGLPSSQVSPEAQRLCRKYRLLSGLAMLASLVFWYGMLIYLVDENGWDLFNTVAVVLPFIGSVILWLLVPSWPSGAKSGE